MIQAFDISTCTNFIHFMRENLFAAIRLCDCEEIVDVSMQCLVDSRYIILSFIVNCSFSLCEEIVHVSMQYLVDSSYIILSFIVKLFLYHTCIVLSLNNF